MKTVWRKSEARPVPAKIHPLIAGFYRGLGPIHTLKPVSIRMLSKFKKELDGEIRKARSKGLEEMVAMFERWGKALGRKGAA